MRSARWRQHATRIVGVGLLVFCGSGVAGCKQSIDLAAVRDMASAATTARDSLNTVAADYYDSCVRRNVYSSISSKMDSYFPFVGRKIPTVTPAPMPPGRISEGELAGPQAALISRLTLDLARSLNVQQIEILLARPDRVDLYNQLSPEIINAFSKTFAKYAPDSLSHLCDKEKIAAQDWQDANSIVVAYFVALGNLAGGAPGKDPFGAKGLAANLQKSSVLSSTQSSAIGSLVTDVIQSIFDAKRRGALAGAITDNDAKVGNAIMFLESIATTHYRKALNREQATSDEFLQENLALARPGADAFTVLQFSDSWSQRTTIFEQRVGAIGSYVNALEKLRKSHAQILTAISNDDASSALAIAKLYYDSLQPDLDAMRKAFAEKKS